MAQSFKHLSQYLNDNNLLGAFNLNGLNLQKLWRTYKQKFADTTWFLNSIGAGTTHRSTSTIQEEIDDCFPCYKTILGIFGEKKNLVGHNLLGILIKTNEYDQYSDESNCNSLGMYLSNESDSEGKGNDNLSHRPSVEYFSKRVDDALKDEILRRSLSQK
ncbi:hypothetical protein O181_123437 [Austropuccinia psidii MF-1]|uniref:Uncharacterized protein n=1 Tax=Austropuccinia psidii MF-1 TaxID=1389203 RepID=A0A9Q3KMP9_9BASI|nr:hypothetical protein [Austropuccinia psidii MF-1]